MPPADRDLLRVRQQIGDRIRCLRQWRDLSQEQLAEALRVDRKTVSRAENGRYAYSIDLLIRTAEVLRVPLYWLVTDDWHTETCQGGPGSDAGA